MKCINFKEKLYYYHYGLVNIFEKRKIAKHLEQCSDCQKEYRLIQNKLKLFNMSEDETTVNTHLDTRILKQVYSLEPDPKTRSVFFSPVIFKAGLSFAVILIILGVWFYQRMYDNSIGILKTPDKVLINKNIVQKATQLKGEVELIVPEQAKAKLIRKGIYDIRLSANTKFHISRKSRQETYIKVSYGKVDFNVEKKKSDMTIETINSLIQITGTKFTLSVSQEKKQTVIQMHEGSVSVKNINNPEQSVKAHDNDKVIIEKNSIPRVIQPLKKQVFKVRERIYLRNGKILLGNIIEQNENDIKLKTKTNVQQLNYKDIEKIEYIK